jgi:hypothetical protein
MLATDGTSRTPPRPAINLPPIVGQILFASTVPALALGFFLLMRRASGALTGPLPAPQLAVTAALVCIWAVAVRLFSPPHFDHRLTFALPISVTLLFAIACSYPATRFIDWLAWLAAIIPLFVINRFHPIAGMPHSSGNHAQPPPAESRLDIESDSQQILQQLTRVRDTSRHESIHGTLAAEFAPGERQTTLFVAFCPPFEYLPEVEAEIADNSPADVKLTQVLHNGAQLEVRLPHAAPVATSITVALFATEAQSA